MSKNKKKESYLELKKRFISIKSRYSKLQNEGFIVSNQSINQLKDIEKHLNKNPNRSVWKTPIIGLIIIFIIVVIIGGGLIFKPINLPDDIESTSINENDVIPSVSISFPTDEENISSMVSIFGNAFDPYDSIDHVQVKIDSESWLNATGFESWNYVLDTSTIENGNHEIFVRCFDGSKYSKISSITVNVQNKIELIIFISNENGNDDIFSMNIDGSDKKQLTFDTNDDVLPAVSCDGTKIAYVSSRSGQAEIYVMDIDGKNEYQLTNFGASHPEWDPNNEWIYISKFSIFRDYYNDIFKIKPNGNNLTFVANGNIRDISAEASPDGKYVYFSSDPNWTPDNKIIRVDSDGSNSIIIENSDSHHETDFPVSPDGNKLLVSEGYSYYGDPGNIYILELISMTNTQVFLPVDKESYRQGSWSPDGTQIVYCYTNDYETTEFDIYLPEDK